MTTVLPSSPHLYPLQCGFPGAPMRGGASFPLLVSGQQNVAEVNLVLEVWPDSTLLEP